MEGCYMPRLKVLISAYACRPGKGSEPGVGWNTAREIANLHEVWVLTQGRHRPVIEAEMARNPMSGLRFAYYEPPRWLTRLREARLGGLTHYYLWQLGAYQVARELRQHVAFDLVHHVTYVSYWRPSFLSLLSVPFVWGPVGGGESTPKNLRNSFSLRGKLYEMLRDFAHWLGEQDPFVRMTARRSVVALATTEETANRLRRLGARDVRIFAEPGLRKEEIERLARHKIHRGGPVRFVSVGRLLSWKGFFLGLRAFAKADLSDAYYWILGDGSERRHLRALANELGIARQVRFWGELPRDETLRILGECHVLVHPSSHDSGGWACMEAMAAGRPVICLDLGGPALQVTESTGFKVPVISQEQIVNDLAEAMRTLALEHERRISMAKAAHARVAEYFDWTKKRAFFDELYSEVLREE